MKCLLFNAKKPYLKRSIFILSIIILFFILYLFQNIIVHRNYSFIPTYEKINLSTILQKDKLSVEDYKILFLQTGLGKSAIDVLWDTKRQEIISYQNSFFSPRELICEPINIIAKQDILNSEIGVRNTKFPSLQTGDILVSLSSHSFGWRHGHSALALSSEQSLESYSIGINSEISGVNSWLNFPNYAILRVKDISSKTLNEVLEFSKKYLLDVPYKLTAGIFGPKFQNYTDENFGLQCSYLGWYAWQNFGVDLDGDGGKLVTPLDLLLSDKVEIVQVYGIDPSLFMKN